MFGDKVFGGIADEIQRAVDSAQTASTETEGKNSIEMFKDAFKAKTVQGIVDIAKEHYADDMRASDIRQIERSLSDKSERKIFEVFSDYEISRHIIEKEHNDALDNRDESTVTTPPVYRFKYVSTPKKCISATVVFFLLDGLLRLLCRSTTHVHTIPTSQMDSFAPDLLRFVDTT